MPRGVGTTVAMKFQLLSIASASSAVAVYSSNFKLCDWLARQCISALRYAPMARHILLRVSLEATETLR